MEWSEVSKWWQISFLYELTLIGMKMVTKNMLNFHCFFLISGWFVTWTCFYAIHDLINGFRSVTTVCISYKMREKKNQSQHSVFLLIITIHVQKPWVRDYKEVKKSERAPTIWPPKTAEVLGRIISCVPRHGFNWLSFSFVSDITIPWIKCCFITARISSARALPD